MQTVNELIREALAYERDAFENDLSVSGANLVDWFADWRQRMSLCLQRELIKRDIDAGEKP